MRGSRSCEPQANSKPNSWVIRSNHLRKLYTNALRARPWTLPRTSRSPTGVAGRNRFAKNGHYPVAAIENCFFPPHACVF